MSAGKAFCQPQTVQRAAIEQARARDVAGFQIPDECEVNPVPPATEAPQCYFGNASSPVAVVPSFGLPVYYEGINPLAAPPPAPPFAQASAAVNRVESVSFLRAGRYLVICAVLPHFNDRMYAWVEVHKRGSLNGDSGD